MTKKSKKNKVNSNLEDSPQIRDGKHKAKPKLLKNIVNKNHSKLALISEYECNNNLLDLRLLSASNQRENNSYIEMSSIEH